jgi:hypothetical protein
MSRLLWVWICGASMLWGYSIGLDSGCRRSEPSVKYPVAFLAWPIAVVVIATGWKSEKKDVCE